MKQDAKSGLHVYAGTLATISRSGRPSPGTGTAKRRGGRVCLPGAGVAELAAGHGPALADKPPLDATNRMGEPVSNGRPFLTADARYARAYNTLGGENMADPVFSDGPAPICSSRPLSQIGPFVGLGCALSTSALTEGV
jgi:hypothetical protein